MNTITIQQKCYARLLSAGKLTIERVPENDKVNTYAYAVHHYGYDISLVGEIYLAQVLVKIEEISQ